MYPGVPKTACRSLTSSVVSFDSVCSLPLAELRHAEVEQLHASIGGDERVGGLHIAMPDALRMGGAKRVGNLHPIVGGFEESQRSAVEARPERLPFQQLGHNVGNAGFDTDVVHDDDIGMIQAAGGARLTAEPREIVSTGRRVAEDLEAISRCSSGSCAR